jgi:hypothetical protein
MHMQFQSDSFIDQYQSACISHLIRQVYVISFIIHYQKHSITALERPLYIYILFNMFKESIFPMLIYMTRSQNAFLPFYIGEIMKVTYPWIIHCPLLIFCDWIEIAVRDWTRRGVIFIWIRTTCQFCSLLIEKENAWHFQLHHKTNLFTFGFHKSEYFQ